MVAYRVQEADLVIPPDWTDQSLTIFKIPSPPGAPPASFVITRDAGKGERPFDEYIDQQVAECKSKLPGFQLKRNDRFTFQGHAGAWLDYTWHNEQGELYIRQVFYDRGVQAFICTLTTTQSGLRHHERVWRQVMNGMKLQPLPAPGAEQEAPAWPPGSA